MKKRILIFLAWLLLFAAAGCSQSNPVSTVVRDGVTYTIDTENSTISDGEHIYPYAFSGNSAGYDVTITYPNGSSYQWHAQNSGGSPMGYGGLQGDYDEHLYTSGDVLLSVLKEGPLKGGALREGKNIFLSVFIALVGIFHAALPETAWYLAYGWRYRDAEPSDAALMLNRLGGAAAIAVAIILFFV